MENHLFVHRLCLSFDTCVWKDFLIEKVIFNSLESGADQRRLLKFLLSERQYDPLERPVLNDSQTLPVTINLALQQIIDFVRRIN